MRTIYIIISSISLLLFNACEDKKTNTHLIPKNNTTKTPKIKKTPISYYKKTTDTSTKKKTTHSELNSYTLKSTQNKSYTFSLSRHKFTSERFNHKTVVLHFIKPSSSLHLNQMASFSKIQNTYPSEITVMSIASEAMKEIATPNYFLAKHHISHFVSIKSENKKLLDYMQKLFHIKALPFSVIYSHGKYFQYFKGMTPIEMIRNDIKQAIQK
jgi:hypothetical protein